MTARTAFETLAERGEARGADTVLRAGRASADVVPGRLGWWVPALALGAALMVVLGIGIGWDQGEQAGPGADPFCAAVGSPGTELEFAL